MSTKSPKLKDIENMLRKTNTGNFFLQNQLIGGKSVVI